MTMNTVAAEWLETRGIIIEALRDMGLAESTLTHNATAIIARLSHAGYTIEKIEREVKLRIDPGSASVDTIRDLFTAMSEFYESFGGSGLKVVVEDYQDQ